MAGRARGRDGTGSHAGFRSQWVNTREGSNPSGRTERGPVPPVAGRTGPRRLPAQQLPHHRHQSAERLAAVADRVLLLRGQLGAGAGLAVRLEDRVVAEAVGAGRGVRAGCRAGGPRRRVRCRRAGRGRRRRRSGRRGAGCRCRRAGRAAGRRLAASSPWRPAQRAEKMPGAPPSTSTHRPESSATAGRPVAWARACALSRAFSAKVTPVSLTSGMSRVGVGADQFDVESGVGEDGVQLGDLVRRCGWRG